MEQLQNMSKFSQLTEDFPVLVVLVVSVIVSKVTTLRIQTNIVQNFLRQTLTWTVTAPDRTGSWIS